MMRLKTHFYLKNLNVHRSALINHKLIKNMPQFDFYSFFEQVILVLAFFSAFYFLFLHTFLINFSKNLKMRLKLKTFLTPTNNIDNVSLTVKNFLF